MHLKIDQRRRLLLKIAGVLSVVSAIVLTLVHFIPGLAPVWTVVISTFLLLLVSVPLIGCLVLTPYLDEQHEVKVHHDSLLASLVSEYQTAQKIAEDKWIRDTSFDPLTHLPNRQLLLKKVYETIQQLQAGAMQHFVFLHLDIDNFKRVNDSVGYLAGDELLVKVAERLRKLVRPQDLVGRIGGDEFGIIVSQIRSDKEAQFIVERLIKAIVYPMMVMGYTITPAVNIGISSVSVGNDSITAEEILRDSDLALHQAKLAGNNRFCFFSPNMRQDMVKVFEISHSIRQAVENQEFYLLFQPIIDAKDLKVMGFEALLRWMHPEKGIIFPENFIPIAEESDIIFDLGRLCIRSVCYQLNQWARVFPKDPTLFVSINLSGKQITDPLLLHELKQNIQKYNLNPACIHIEITESILVSNKREILKVIDELKGFGMKLSIDDFGTGYSSLNTLSQFPFDYLKIDRTFIRDIKHNPKNLHMISMVIALGKSIGFLVIIEGIETIEQFYAVKDLGCKGLQGFLLSQPLPVDALEHRLRQGFDPHQWM